METIEAFLSLVAQSPLLGSTPATARTHLDALRHLTLQAPAFRLKAGHDLKHAPELLADLIAPLLSHFASDAA